ncbi:3-deoxy-7-phosphoheptulonate synthase [bacterium]|nr:3-deoxy-7-phosphoheptulonate synthase [bacterium]
MFEHNHLSELFLQKLELHQKEFTFIKHKNLFIIDSKQQYLLEKFDSYKVFDVKTPYILSNKEIKSDFFIDFNDFSYSNGDFIIIAGPCTIENREYMNRTAQFVKDEQLHFMRGGAYKPRKSPYTFQGLGKDGIEIFKEVSDDFGVKIVTELLDIRTIDEAIKYSDIIQIGARNMHNYPLLKELGKIDKPILLKRGLSASIDELLLAADYILSEGNDNVILCERGIKTFETQYKSTLDLTAVALLKEKTHLPIIVDPSHAAGNSKIVPQLAMASLAVGADGLLIEMHPEPSCAVCDGEQSLQLDQFSSLMVKLRELATFFNKKIV